MFPGYQQSRSQSQSWSQLSLSLYKPCYVQGAEKQMWRNDWMTWIRLFDNQLTTTQTNSAVEFNPCDIVVVFGALGTLIISHNVGAPMLGSRLSWLKFSIKVKSWGIHNRRVFKLCEKRFDNSDDDMPEGRHRHYLRKNTTKLKNYDEKTLAEVWSHKKRLYIAERTFCLLPYG